MKRTIERFYSIIYGVEDQANAKNGNSVSFSTKAFMFYSTIILALLFLILIILNIAGNLSSV